jgi:phenylacetate-coenzyme A ligase PaaK-like adenylate-forming protein
MQKIQIPPRTSWNPIDEALYGPDDLYSVPKEKADPLRFKAIRFSFTYHYTHNPFYNNFCKYRNVKPTDLKTFADFEKIPLIPDVIFKGYPEPAKFIAWLRGISTDEITYPSMKSSSYGEIITRLNDYGVHVLFSSGSSGKCTFVPRDDLTIERSDQWRRNCLTNFQKFDLASSALWFGPKLTDTNWVLGFNVGADFKYFKEVIMTEDYKVTPEGMMTVMGDGKPRGPSTPDHTRSLQIIEQLHERQVGVVITIMPFILSTLLTYLENEGKTLNLGNKWRITTGGGWKKSADVKIRQEDLFNKVEQVLGIPSQNCRDLYGLSESSVPFPGCEGGYYHIPHTFLHPYVLDADLTPLGFEQHGRFAFIDTLANACPGFIITGDRVKLLETCPSCSRPGPVLVPPITRMPGVEDRGCANVVRNLMASEADQA